MKIVFACFVLCVTTFFIYAFLAINELKLKMDLNKISEAVTLQKASTLEGGTTVRKMDLDNYLLFSNINNIDVFKKKELNKNTLENKKTVEINESIELPKLNLNHCRKYKCIQIRKKFTDIPSSVWKALLGTEDFRFLEHRGVDPFSIARAIVVDIIAMKFVQGGSTLTQQLVKNLFLSNEKKLSRKIKEIIYAFYIENVLEKEDIIELYLNEVFWGVHQGVYLKGFYAASLAYFEKKPKELTDYEATILVSLLKGPNYYKPSKSIDRLKDRTTAVYRRLIGLSLVTEKIDEIWNDEKWQNFQNNFINNQKKNEFYSFYLISQNEEQYIDSFDKLVFYNAIDERISLLKERLGSADIAVKAIIADKECKEYDCINLFSYYSKFQREKRIAIEDEKHQVGSLLKPIVYDSFIDLGRDYSEEISTAPIQLKLLSGIWSPKDYSKAKLDKITLKEALQKSKNIPLIRVANEIGFDVLEKSLDKKIPNLLKPLGEYPAQLLGSLELSLEQVLETYSRFLSKRCDELKNTNTKFENSILNYMSVAGETTISRLVRSPLKGALVFGKTGTSNNGLDNWYFAFDGKTNYLIWFGVESERDKIDLKISGASTSFMIFQDFMINRGKQISEVYCH